MFLVYIRHYFVIILLIALESLFFLLSRVPSMLPPIAEKFEAFVTKVGKAAVANVAESAINVFFSNISMIIIISGS